MQCGGSGNTIDLGYKGVGGPGPKLKPKPKPSDETQGGNDCDP